MAIRAPDGANNDLRKDTAAHASTVAIHNLQRVDNYETVRHILQSKQSCIKFRKHFAKYILMAHTVYSSSSSQGKYLFSQINNQMGERNTLVTSWRFHCCVQRDSKHNIPNTNNFFLYSQHIKFASTR